MNNNSNIKEFYAACGFMVVAMAVFSFLGFGFLGTATAAAALCFIMLRHNMTCVVFGVVIAFVTDCVLSLSFQFLNGIVICFSAMCINIAVRSHANLLKAVAAGVLGIFAAYALSFAIAGIFNIEGMRISDVKEVVGQTKETLDYILAQSGADSQYSPSEIAVVKNLVTMSIVPTTVLITSVVFSYLAVIVQKKMLTIVKSDLGKEICDFSQIRADRTCVAIFIVCFAVYALISLSNQVVGAAAFAMCFVLGAFFYACGLSVGWFYIKKQAGVKKILFLIGFAIAAVVLLPSIFIIGIVDSFADVRKLRKEK